MNKKPNLSARTYFVHFLHKNQLTQNCDIEVPYLSCTVLYFSPNPHKKKRPTRSYGQCRHNQDMAAISWQLVILQLKTTVDSCICSSPPSTVFVFFSSLFHILVFLCKTCIEYLSAFLKNDLFFSLQVASCPSLTLLFEQKQYMSGSLFLSCTHKSFYYPMSTPSHIRVNVQNVT